MTYKLYSVGTDETSGTAVMTAIRSLSDEETTRYREACTHLHEIEQLNDQFALVGSNLQAVRTAFREFELRLSTEGQGPLAPAIQERRMLQFPVLNFLLSLGLYRDHRRAHLTRRYGRASAPYEEFMAAWNEAVEAEGAFALVEALRDHTQHHGMPLQVIKAHQEIVLTGGEERIHSTPLVGCRVSELLSARRNWTRFPAARAFLQTQPEEFPILPHLEKAAERVERVEAATIRALLNCGVWDDARLVVSTLKEAYKDDKRGVVASLLLPSETEPVPGWTNFLMPPLMLLAWLKLLRAIPRAPHHEIDLVALSMTAPPSIV